MGKNKFIIGGIIIGVCLFAFALSTPHIKNSSPSLSPTAAIHKQVNNDVFIYSGEDGKDALRILQEKTKVEQEKSGLVSSINGRKADPKKKEFWAFYVNGKFAQVGPAEYQTKDTDRIEWKIEHY